MTLTEYPVWDRTTRVFHWLKVLCVFSLMGIGTTILFAGDLGVSNEGKIALKTVHVSVGYVFIANLAWRLIWGFIGGPYARWSALLPGGKGYIAALGSHLRGVIQRKPDTTLGHNPIGRIAVTLLLTALLVQGASGIVLAGTDVYMPPFGQYFAEWVASPDMDPDAVRPYAPETVNDASYQDMRAFRAPIIKTHMTNYYVLLILVLLHVIGVVTTEVRSGGSLISAMFTGRKIIAASRDTAGESSVKQPD